MRSVQSTSRWIRFSLILACASLWLAGGQRVAQAGTPARSILGSGTVILRGDLGSTVTLTMTGAFSVGQAKDLTWNLALLTASGVSSYQQDVQKQTFDFDVPPDASLDLTIDGRPFRSFHWTNPPSQTVIHVVQRLKLHIATTLSSFKSSAPYPLGQVPAEARPYLTVPPSLRLPASTTGQIRAFAAHRTESAVVAAVSNWVASRLRYDAGTVGRPQDASTVLTRRTAVCRGYANLSAAVLRKLGIPAQVVYGWLSPAPIRDPGGSTSIQWSTHNKSGELHTWLNVYFPGTGWVPFDPQLEKFFVDPRHVTFFTGLDAGMPVVSTWWAVPDGTASPTGRPLSGSATMSVPGDGVSSKVTVASHDSFNLRVARVVQDVKSLTLYSR